MIRTSLTHILLVSICVISGFLLSSCIYDYPMGDDLVRAENDSTLFLFRISALGATTSQQANRPIESVKSLRIIILDEKGTLDVNEKVSLPYSESAAENFSYLFIRNLNSGKKKLYLIANEESVGEVRLVDNSDLPNGIPLSNLSAMLSYFKPDAVDSESNDSQPENNSNSQYAGTIFEKVLNRVYYKNDYSSITEGNAIFLPYTAYYEIDVKYHNFNQIEQPLYLVPVAAKFDFNFINYRQKSARIDDVIISSINSHNYLNAQLHEDEKKRTLFDESVWWIDWLQACAEGSKSAGDFEAFNNRWGWIKRYDLPLKDEVLINKNINTDNNLWVVDALVDKSNPSRLSLGPYYVPESINIPPTEESGENEPEATRDNEGEGEGVGDSMDSNTQSYFLTFKVRDASSEEISTLENYHITTLKALFRATHVIVNVEFYESKVEIYAEIAPWEKRLFLGFVQEEDD